MSLNIIHRLYGMPMCLVCMFFCVPVLTFPSVLAELFYSQKFWSDGRMPKLLGLYWTDAIVWLLFRTVEGFCPTMMAENSTLYLNGHWGSAPRIFLFPLLLNFFCICLVVLFLFTFCIHPVLLFSGLLTLHSPICYSWELFLLFAVLESLFDMIAWAPHLCDSWWAQLVSHCCWFIPLPWCTCFLVASVLGTALYGRRKQCFWICIQWCIRQVPCVPVVFLFWSPRGECV